MKKTVPALVAAGAVALGAIVTIPAQASDIASFQTVYATDVAVASLGGMRSLGTGNIEVTGVTGTVTYALLYWHGPTNSDDPASNASVSLAGTSVTGTNIGTSSDNCWSYDNSQAYRADVTGLVTGNGTYALADFTKDDAEVNGASLMVFFDDGDDSNNRDVVLFDGNDSNTTNEFDADGWNVSLPGINYSEGSAAMRLIVSDGQGFTDDGVTVNGTVIAPGPEVFQGDTVPSAGSDNNGFLWDQKSYDVTSLLTPGDNTLALSSGYTSDCLSLIVAAVDLPAGSAPNQPTTTTTTARRRRAPPRRPRRPPPRRAPWPSWSPPPSPGELTRSANRRREHAVVTGPESRPCRSTFGAGRVPARRGRGAARDEGVTDERRLGLRDPPDPRRPGARSHDRCPGGPDLPDDLLPVP